MQKLIMFATNKNKSEFAITVLLPVDEKALYLVRLQLDELRTLVLSDEDVKRFEESIAYLPTTLAELQRANQLHNTTGLDWHSACERAKATTMDIYKQSSGYWYVRIKGLETGPFETRDLAMQWGIERAKKYDEEK